MHVTLYADGGSRGNPGPAAAGGVLLVAGKEVAAFKAYLGVRTNNEAEYAAVILGIERAIALGATVLVIRLDSKLIVEQVSGRWKVKDARMQLAVAKVRELLKKVPKWEIGHIPRAQNAAADALVNKALDERRSVG